MKRSHEYDSPVLSRIVSVVTIFAICICSVCACLTTYKMSSLSAGTVAAPATTAPSDNGGSSTPAPATNPSTPSGDSGNSGTTDNPGTDAQPSDSGDSGESAAPANSGEVTDPATVLAKYTEIMDQLKTCKHYHKKEFQALPEDQRDLGTIGNIILPIAEGMMTTEDKAEDQDRTDPEQIPVIKNAKGCLLTDVSAIKSASMKDDGTKTTIVIVLNDEEKSEPTPEGASKPLSNVGAMFNPMSSDDINNKLAEIKAVKVNSFTLTYKDCTATLVFDNATGHVESLTQIMNAYITANVKAVLVTIDGYANLKNTMTIDRVEY